MNCIRDPSLLRPIPNRQKLARDNFAVMSAEATVRMVTRDIALLVSNVLSQCEGRIKEAWIDDIQAWMKMFRFRVEDEDGNVKEIQGSEWPDFPGITAENRAKLWKVDEELAEATEVVVRSISSQAKKRMQAELRLMNGEPGPVRKKPRLDVDGENWVKFSFE